MVESECLGHGNARHRPTAAKSDLYNGGFSGPSSRMESSSSTVAVVDREIGQACGGFSEWLRRKRARSDKPGYIIALVGAPAIPHFPIVLPSRWTSSRPG